MQTEFIELVKVVGTFALLVIVAIVLLMLLVSIVDRHSRPKSEPKKNEDVKTRINRGTPYIIPVDGNGAIHRTLQPAEKLVLQRYED